MKYIKLTYLYFLIIIFSYSFKGISQESKGVVVDEIIGRVDDFIVLRSELESTYLDILSRGERISGNTKCGVLKDLITNNELASGAMDVNATRNEFVPLHVSEVKRYIYEGGATRMDIKSSPQFEIGDMVSVANVNSLGHTRLPRYVRGKRGVVHEYHGAHVFPDQNALGTRIGQHLYSVYFTAPEIWGNVREANFGVNVDLWEPYLEVI